MKKLIIILLFISKISSAQFISAELQASGLTCSMCNLATQKQLQTIDFIDSINPDLEHNIFHLKFKRESIVDLDLIKKKVEDAGFSVASLIMNLQTTQTDIKANEHLSVNDNLFHVLEIAGKKKINGSIQIKILDKGFVSDKQYKKVAKKINTITDNHTTGNAELKTIKRVYHVEVL